MRIHLAPVWLLFGLLATTAKADPVADPAPTTADQTGANPPPAPSGDLANAMAAPAPAAPRERTANNVLYIEGLGPGLFYSLNYERMFGDFSARIGFEYLSFSAAGTSADGTSGGSASASFLGVPLGLDYLGVGSKQNILELGVGATILNVGAGASAFDTNSKSSDHASATAVLPFALVGYRYQPVDGGFVLRVGLSPVFAGSSIPILPWPYLALGGAFGP